MSIGAVVRNLGSMTPLGLFRAIVECELGNEEDVWGHLGTHVQS
jgi:hypothetical protein